MFDDESKHSLGRAVAAAAAVTFSPEALRRISIRPLYPHAIEWVSPGIFAHILGSRSAAVRHLKTS